MRVIGKDRTGCDACNPLDEIIARIEQLERRVVTIVARVQGIPPDGTGNVTLPTSDSVDGPLYGNIGAFAMSSEVKEAAEDVHQYASAIADDVIEIQTDLQALSDRVDELEPEGLDALTAAVQSLQNTVAMLETGKVNRSGDTMTGTLYTIRSGWNNRVYKSTDIDATALTSADNRPYMLQVMDKNNLNIGNDTIYTFDSRVMREMGLKFYDSSGNPVSICYMQMQAKPDGSAYITIPNWSLGTNSNDNKILTIAMANSLPSLVHSTGNETIAGEKTFTSRTRFAVSDYVPIVIRRTDTDIGVADNKEIYINFNDKNSILMGRFGVANYENKSVSMGAQWGGTWYTLGLRKNASDASVTGVAPTTPTNATSNEIATADWVISKINQVMSQNGLTGL